MNAILKFIGGAYWEWPQDHIKEIRERGPSIRIAPDAIPDIPTPYPILFAHPKGTFHVETVGMCIYDLFTELEMEDHLPNDPDVDDYIQDGLPTLALIGIFRHLSKFGKDEYERLVEKYGIKFRYAITHYSYITGTQVVIGDAGEGVKTYEELVSRGVDIEPVKVVRVEDIGNE